MRIERKLRVAALDALRSPGEWGFKTPPVAPGGGGVANSPPRRCLGPAVPAPALPLVL
jgi:hypothetical protein